ncbi:MAG: putative collagen-binding domain-containing protein [Planctomycetota bacterium]|nr:putative collagen-binding domain-containing protein [Planctomycetota bacterium]
MPGADLASIPSKPAGGVLRVHPGNSRYFTDDSGKAIYMTGSHVWWNIVAKGGRNLPYSDADFEAFLDYIESFDHNFTRIWIGSAYPGYSAYPWQRTGPGDAADGKPKFDMTKLNPSYFDHLRDRLLRLQDRGMYFSVMFFGSFNGFKTSDKWKTVAWHPSNNINPELADAFDEKDGNSFFTTDPAALEIQQLLVRRMIDTVGDLDNLTWEIMNEARFPTCANWQNEMVNYVKSYEAGKPKQHLVGITAGPRKANELLKSGPADWISPSAKDGRYDYRRGGPAAYSDKIVISDVDHLWAVATDDTWLAIRKWVWQTFTRGNHPIFMDQYNSYEPRFGAYGEINPKWDPIRAAMGHTRRFAAEFADLAEMLPDESIADSGYCLADAGQEYLVYDPSGGTVVVNLAALQGTASYKWFNPQTGKTVTGGSVNGGENRTFRAPFSGDSVLHIIRLITPQNKTH